MALMGATLLTGIGCGAKEVPWASVSGIVTVDKKPLTVGWITFYPDEEKNNSSPNLPFAEIKQDGSFTLTTNNKPGATPGFYKVVVTATHDDIPVRPRRNPDGTLWQPRWLTHQKYTTPATTDLRVEIVDKPPPGMYDLHLAK